MQDGRPNLDHNIDFVRPSKVSDTCSVGSAGLAHHNWIGLRYNEAQIMGNSPVEQIPLVAF